jgi:hypothetical protein
MAATEQEVRELTLRACLGLLERLGTGARLDERLAARLSPQARAYFYNEDQPRGEGGRWGEGSGGGKSEARPYAGEGKEGFVSRESYDKAFQQAQDKIAACPRPTQEQIDKNREMIAASKRPGGDFRGSSYQRRSNTGKLLTEFGDGEKSPCVWCGRELDASTLTQDKIFTGHEGGRYTFANLLPSCLGCNQSRGAASITGSSAQFAARAGAIVTASVLGWADAQANNTEEEQDVALPTLDGHPESVTGKLLLVHVTNDAGHVDYTKYIVGGVDVDPATIDDPTKGPPQDLNDLLDRQGLTAAGAPGPDRARSRNLVEIDRELRAKLHVAANSAMKRTLERCGAKIVSKARTAAGAPLRPFVNGTPQYRVPMAVPNALLASLGLDEHVVLQTAWDDLHDQFEKWVGDAQRSSARVAARIVKQDPDVAIKQLTRAHDVSRDQAWSHLQQGLNAQAVGILSSDDEEVNPDGLVPLGGIRAAMALAGGIAAMSAGIGKSGMPVDSSEVLGQVGTGGIISTYLEANGATIEEYEWVHGATDNAFPPHEDLDGVIFQNFDDDVLAVRDGFPDVPFEHPGDHPGCGCDFVQHWTASTDAAPTDDISDEAQS